MSLLVAAVAAGVAYSYFGGFGTGACADTEEFAKYACAVDDITVPVQARIIALGEATHGNAEFQQLKLDVFKLMVEKHGVRAFALEGDYGGCEAVNRYIHGGEGTLRDAAAAIGFTIYRTREMEQLIAWMREYNATAKEGEDLRFYGFDMQNIDWNHYFLIKTAEKHGIDATALKQQWDIEKADRTDSFAIDQWIAAIEAIRQELQRHEGTEAGVHSADILLQNHELGKAMSSTNDGGVSVRDRYMAYNVRWILAQEAARGYNSIFISAHNGHVMRVNKYDKEDKAMGHLLADEFGDEYFVVGTDFYKSRCNLPTASRAKRSNHTFYSHDPLAKASKKCGLTTSYLDLSRIPTGSPLKQYTTGKVSMGSVGEGYNPLMAVSSRCYCKKASPETVYDGVIFVANAHPTHPDMD